MPEFVPNSRLFGWLMQVQSEIIQVAGAAIHLSLHVVTATFPDMLKYIDVSHRWRDSDSFQWTKSLLLQSRVTSGDVTMNGMVPGKLYVGLTAAPVSQGVFEIRQPVHRI